MKIFPVSKKRAPDKKTDESPEDEDVVEAIQFEAGGNATVEIFNAFRFGQSHANLLTYVSMLKLVGKLN